MKSRTLSYLATAILAAGCTPSSSSLTPSRTSPAITPEDTKSRIYLVADDSMLGREAGARGNFVMTSYIAREMERLGLQPGGENGTWFQAIPMVRRSADSTSTLTVKGETLKVRQDFIPIRPTATVRLSRELAAATYETVYGGRAGDSSVTLDAAEVKNRIIVLDAPLGANGRPTSVYGTAAAATIARYPQAAAIMIAALDLQTPNAIRSSGLGLTGQTTPMRTPFGILVSRSAAAKIIGAPIESSRPGTRGADVRIVVECKDRPVSGRAMREELG